MGSVARVGSPWAHLQEGTANCYGKSCRPRGPSEIGRRPGQKHFQFQTKPSCSQCPLCRLEMSNLRSSLVSRKVLDAVLIGPMLLASYTPQGIHYSLGKHLSIGETMCSPALCSSCGKVTWSGCGQHIEEALAGVPADQRCTCN